jgi:hypothetical protein
MKKKLGLRKFNKLVLRANKIKKWSKDDLKLLRKKLRELIKINETI